MDRVYWFAVSNPEQKRFVFVPAAMGGDDSELHVMLCASADGQRTTVHLDHHFVPSDWLKREFPKHFELIEIIETRAQLAIAAAFQQVEQN